jgi:hypothetical protein
MISLMGKANGGGMVVIAPIKELKRLKVQSADDGYMTRRLKGLHATSPDFEKIFLEFSSHAPEFEMGDRWPPSYYDAPARGLPKDGATLLVPNGSCMKGAAKILGLPSAPFQWAGHGTRHEAALSLAAFLRHAIILIKSSATSPHFTIFEDDSAMPSSSSSEASAGKLRCIVALQRGYVAMDLSEQGPDEQVTDDATKNVAHAR